jgi:hypothetical protein
VLGLSRGDQPDNLAAHGVGDGVQPPFDPAEREPPRFAVIVAGVLGVEPVGVEKDARRKIER